MAGLLAAVTAFGVCYVAARSMADAERRGSFALFRRGNPAAIVGVLMAGLTFAFSVTMWLYAVKFTPYVLTALFTVLILWAMLRWWECADRSEAVKWLFIIGLLFGLDFSVHRTNLLMMPAFALWLVIRNPRTFLSAKAWLFGGTGLLLGLAFHFVIMLMAAANPIINSNDPTTLARFWEYVSLKQYGGGWLVNLYPRKMPFWSYQVMDYLRAFGKNFFYIDGRLSLLGVLPGLLGFYGLLVLFQRNRRLATSVLMMLFMMSMGIVIYFNIPEFFRAFDRHYLPSFLLFSVLIAYGSAHLLTLALSRVGLKRWITTLLVVVLTAGAAGNQLLSNYEAADSSKDYFALDAARNYLSGLDKNGIVFSSGDNDTWPLLYVQTAEGFRVDVTVINLGLLNTSWEVSNLQRREPDFPLKLSEEGYARLRPRRFPDTTIVIPYTLPDNEDSVSSLLIDLTPEGQQPYFLVQDQLVLRIIQRNKWVRPIYFTSPYAWLKSHLRPEGVVHQLVTADDPGIDRALLRENLFERYAYRGFSDPPRRLEYASKWAGVNLITSFMMLAYDYHNAGEYEQCWLVMDRMKEVISVEAVNPPDHLKSMTESLCVQP